MNYAFLKQLKFNTLSRQDKNKIMHDYYEFYKNYRKFCI